MRRKYRLLHIALSRKIRVQQEKFILWAGLEPGGLGPRVLTPWPGDAPRFRVGEYAPGLGKRRWKTEDGRTHISSWKGNGSLLKCSKISGDYSFWTPIGYDRNGYKKRAPYFSYSLHDFVFRVCLRLRLFQRGSGSRFLIRGKIWNPGCWRSLRGKAKQPGCSTSFSHPLYLSTRYHFWISPQFLLIPYPIPADFFCFAVLILPSY